MNSPFHHPGNSNKRQPSITSVLPCVTPTNRHLLNSDDHHAPPPSPTIQSGTRSQIQSSSRCSAAPPAGWRPRDLTWPSWFENMIFFQPVDASFFFSLSLFFFFSSMFSELKLLHRKWCFTRWRLVDVLSSETEWNMTGGGREDVEEGEEEEVEKEERWKEGRERERRKRRRKARGAD